MPNAAAREQPRAQGPNASELNEIGIRLVNRGRLQEALSRFRAAAEKRPSDPSIQFNLGLTFFRLRQFRPALEALEIASRDARYSEEAAYLRGAALFELGELAAAGRTLEPLRGLPNYAENVLYMLVEANRRLHRVSESQQAFAELLARFPKSALVHKLLGMAYDSQLRYEEAVREFQAALLAKPAMPEANFAIGYIRWKQKQDEEAAAWLRKELAIQSCYGPAHYYLGEIARRKQELREARSRYRKALECDAGYTDAFVALGIVLEESGEHAVALRMLREAVRREPQKREAHYRLARLLQKSGRHKEAEAEFRRVEELRAREAEKAAAAIGQQ